MPLIQGTEFVWSACTVKIIRLKICVCNLNYDTSQLHTLSFSPGKIFTKSKLGSHTSNTPLICGPNGQIRKEITHSYSHLNGPGISSIPPQVTQIRIRPRQSSTPARAIYTIRRSLTFASVVKYHTVSPKKLHHFFWDTMYFVGWS